jgi:23S rRNA pseudouridine2604 synthase
MMNCSLNCPIEIYLYRAFSFAKKTFVRYADRVMKTMRINKYLSRRGVCSRREADRRIEAGRVTVNGQKPELGQKVTDKDDVRVDGKPVGKKPTNVYIAFNKPVGLITTANEDRPDNVISHIDYPERIYPVGRLDVASQGLLLLTNDGELTNRLTHPKFEHEKEYYVEVERSISGKDLRKLAEGVELEGGMTAPADVERKSGNAFLLTIHEGRNRQIRRMCKALGYEVITLKRLRVATVDLGNLSTGAWRELHEDEVQELKETVGLN